MSNETNYTGRRTFLCRTGKLLILGPFFFLYPLLASSQTIWYVKENAVGLNNGSDWANAFTDLQPAINAAAASTATNKQIWIAAGTYRPTQIAGNGTEPRDKSFTVLSNIALYGGLSGMEPANYDLALRNVRANETILSGDIGVIGDNTDNSYHVIVSATLAGGARLDGFTITGGNANGTTGSITFQGENFERSYCGGIYNRQNAGTFIIANCTVKGNTGINHGGIYNFSSDPLIISCIICNNIATGRGNNTGGTGGLANKNSSPTVVNCLITGNKGDDGGGVGNATLCSATYINCTIAGNTALGSNGENNDNAFGGGVANLNYSTTRIYNSIVWGNTAFTDNNLSNYDGTSTFYVLNSIIEGGFAGGAGNLDVDPIFINPVAAINAPTASGDYHIACNSPAINSANNGNYTSGPPFDLDGNPRIIGAVIDMGAYEYQTAPSQNIVIQSITPGAPFRYCPGNLIAADFTINNCPGNFAAGNVFTLQLSDANGNFSSPVSIGTLASASPGMINAAIPVNTPPGNGYRIRIVSSNQLFTSEPFNIAITILSSQTPAVTISASAAQICAGDNVVFTAVGVNEGANPIYQWKKNGNNVGANSSSYSDNTLANTDLVSCELTNTEGCASPSMALSNQIGVVVNTVIPSISITADNSNICSNQTANFSALISGGGNSPVYQWKKNGINAGTNAPACSFSGLSSSDIITCELTSDAACANLPNVLSNALQVNVIPVVVPAIIITADKSEICPGESVTFSSTIANGGANPVYLWKKNGINVGANNNSYSDATLISTDIITCELQSSAGCASPQTATSNELIIAVNVITPIITIHADKDEICSGETANFNAVISGGGNFPLYQWRKNGINVGTNSPSLPGVTLVSTDVVSCSLTSSYGCVSQPTVESNELSVIINPLPEILLTKSNDINCTDAEARLMAKGGVKYQWQEAEGIENLSVYNPLVHPLQTTAYTVRVTTDRNCSATKTIVVNVSSQGAYGIPNSFTPNNDGKNDCFGVGFLLNISNLDFSIYNRWGQRIFYTKNPDQCWDGRYGGHEQDAGAYIYVIKATGECGSINKKGIVFLVR
ncbi:MAG: gliding motility-associated C-terminal domain-containing protein [Bacteroidota bacterium]|nr:gliding motility-associated C-terminal domain-containing protein [Bacteroidota bacterium]